MSTTHIALLFGSRSTEHDVSITSAFAVYKALQNIAGYIVHPIYISRSGKWYLQDNLNNLSIYENFDETNHAELYIDMHQQDNKLHLIEKSSGLFGRQNHIDIDVVFPVLHGKAGEDGSIQGFCETLSIPYVGPRVASAAICLDKTITNYILSAIGAPYIPSQVIRSLHELQDIQSTLTYPVFVKPYDGGSTIGVSKCTNIQELQQGAEVAFYFSKEVLIQQSIEHCRELNCSVASIENIVTTTQIQEVYSNAEYLTFDEKYIFESGGGSMSGIENKVKIPAELPESLEQKIINITKKIYQEFKLFGNARIDFLYQEKENNLYIIEINTIPGALQMYLREKSGISKEVLLTNLVQESVDYNNTRIGNISFKSNILKNTSSFIKK